MASNGFVEFESTYEVAAYPSASGLAGLVIHDRWEIISLLHESPQETGGNFGVGYVVVDRQDGSEWFLKVIDYRRNIKDFVILAALLNQAQFEIAMHKHCGERRMSKVVQMQAHGQLVFRRMSDGEEYNFIALVLERGLGDIKSHTHYAPDASPYWKISVLRDVALAITQIERGNLAHNDVKPSNVIRFESTNGTHSLKLGDIARAVKKDGTGPFDGLDWSGDPRHMPIENFYGWKESEWQNRRTSADAYMLGSLLSYLFLGASITERILSSMPPAFHPGVYKGPYRAILDIVRHTWTTVIRTQVTPALPSSMRDELTNIVLWLTDPDPALRGDPNARRAGLVGIDRIHSRLVRLAQAAQIQERMVSN